MNVLFFLTETAGGGTTWITMGLLLVVMIAMFFFTSRSNKKQEKEAQNIAGGKLRKNDGLIDDRCNLNANRDRRKNQLPSLPAISVV